MFYLKNGQKYEFVKELLVYMLFQLLFEKPSPGCSAIACACHRSRSIVLLSLKNE